MDGGNGGYECSGNGESASCDPQLPDTPCSFKRVWLVELLNLLPDTFANVFVYGEPGFRKPFLFCFRIESDRFARPSISVYLLDTGSELVVGIGGVVRRGSCHELERLRLKRLGDRSKQNPGCFVFRTKDVLRKARNQTEAEGADGRERLRQPRHVDEDTRPTIGRDDKRTEGGAGDG